MSVDTTKTMLMGENLELLEMPNLGAEAAELMAGRVIKETVLAATVTSATAESPETR